jgi:hypothetical protein
MERGVAPCICGLAAPFSILRESANTAIQIESFPRLDHPPDTGERIAAQVVAVQLDQVEGVQEHVAVMLTVADTLERCEPVVIAQDGFPIDDARP